MPLPLVNDELDQETWEKHGGAMLPTDALEQWSARLDLATDSTLLPQIQDMMELRKLNKDPAQKTLSIEELQNKYPSSGISWSEPKKESVAQYIFNQNEKKNKLDSIVARGPQNAFTSAAGFGADVIASLTDPLELAANVAGGAAIKAGGFVVGKGFTAAVTRGVAEGALTSTVLEPVRMARESYLERETSLADSAMNVAVGTVAGGVFEGGIHAVSRGIDVGFKRSTEALRERMTKSAAGQMLSNRFPNVAAFQDLHTRERMGVGPKVDGPDYSGRTNYKFQEVNHTAPVSGKVYVGTQSLADDASLHTPGDNQNSLTPFGSVDVAVDNARVSNNYAATSFNDVSGVIHEFDLDGANVLPLDQKLPQPLAVEVSAILKEVADQADLPAIREMAESIDSGAAITGKQIYKALEDAPDSAADALNAMFKEKGFDALHFVEGDEARHNGFVILNREKLKQSGSFASDKRLVGGLTEKEVGDLVSSHSDPKQRLDYDQKTIDAIKESEETLDADLEATPEERLILVNQELKRMGESNLLKQHHLDALKALDEALANKKKAFADHSKSLQNCLVGG